MFAFSVTTPLGGKVANKAGILYFHESVSTSVLQFRQISCFAVMLSTAICIFISDSLWWGSVLEQKMEDFLASGKNEAMIALLDSLQKANGEIF